METAMLAALVLAGRPNVLWLVAEDMGPEIGCYGYPVATPNLDRLSARGQLFRKAYTTCPVCSPSRSAFMTGMYQTTIGAHHHRSHRDDGFALPAGVRLVTECFRDGGYRTVNLRELPKELGFNGTAKTDWNFTPPPVSFDGTRWADLKAADGRPFLAQLNFQETHRAFRAPKRTDPASVRLPPYYPDHPVTRADWADYLDAIFELDRKVGLVLARLEADGLAGNTVVVFTADNGQAMVRGKQFCYEEGLHVPLIVALPPGMAAPPGYAAGTANDRLVEAIDLAPTLLALCGLPVPAAMQGEALFGDPSRPARPPRRYAFGARDRCDETVFRLRTATDGRYRYIRNFTPDRPFLQANGYKEKAYPVWNLLKRLHAEGKLDAVQATLCQPTMPAEELYDLAADPHEVSNLAADPAHAATLVRLRAALEDWIERSGDQGRTAEPPELAKAMGVTRPGTPPLSGYALPPPPKAAKAAGKGKAKAP